MYVKNRHDSKCHAGFFSLFLFFSVKTVRTKLTGLDPDGRDQVVQPVISEGGKILLLADILDHLGVPAAAGIRLKIL